MPGISARSDPTASRTPSRELAKQTGQKEAMRNIKYKITRSNSLREEGKTDESTKRLHEAHDLDQDARKSYPDWDKDVFDVNNMKEYAKGENSVVYEHPLNTGKLVKIMNKSEAELNATMGNLKIGPNVVISPRKDSNGMYNVIMDKIKGDTLENLWPKMEFEAKKNAALQMKAIIEQAGKKGYKLTDNNAANFILNDGKITRIDFDNAHVKKIEQGGEEKAVKGALAEAKSMFDLEGIDDDIWKYLPKESSSPGF
jgi:predicted Ser/Thr protein kinase